jgi:uncharacterized protein (DUF2252 family)
VGLIAGQAATRLPELVPIRHGRMMASPFAFFRGAALPMAADLATLPRSDLIVQLGGDAHLSNFGLFASPERDLLFDMNDFDETLAGPFEWDLCRLAASFAVAARGRGLSEHAGRHAARMAVRSYRERMATYAGMDALSVYYAKVDVNAIMEFVDERAKPYLEDTVRSAMHHDALAGLSKLTEVVGGRRRLVDKPPVIYHLAETQEDRTLVTDGLASYALTLQEDRRALLERFELVDIAVKVVGVGSVGLTALVVLMQERASGQPLLLQVKQAEASVLERFLGASPYASHGERVVAGQRRLQAASDILLGWTVGRLGRHHYVRQLHDLKGSAVLEAMTERDLATWAKLCGWALARGHASSGDPAAIGAYLGDDDALDHAIGRFAETYAHQTEADHAAFVEAIDAGRLPAERGV